MNEEVSQPQKMGLLRLLWGIVARPRATFRYLNENGRRLWWLPALIAVVMVILPIVVGSPIQARLAREAVAEIQAQMDEMLSPEQRQQMEQAQQIAASPLVITVFPSITAVLGLVVGWLAWAGALYLVGMVAGGHASFGALFRMVVWAWIPYALRGFLQTLYILFTGQLIAHPGLSGLVADTRSVGEMLQSPPTTGQLLASSFLSRVDLFLFWNLALLVVGTTVVTRLSGRKATALVLAIWLLFALIALVPTLISGLFMGQSVIFGG
ncbi:MAG: YIP1 family protein [Thermoflexales bacterium]|nr:YIP1 family protein [Thermoflexales bacterium]